MPKRRSIKTSSPSDFEPKRKNPISLGSDSNIDNDLKPLTIGGLNTGMELSKDSIRFTKDVITETEQTNTLKVSKIKGNDVASLYEPQLIMQSKSATNNTSGLWFNVFTSGTTFIKSSGTFASLSFEAASSIYSTCGSDSAFGFVWYKGDIAAGTNVTVSELHSTGQLKMVEVGSAVADVAGYGQIWIKNSDPNELWYTNDDGNDIQLTSGTAAAFVGDITSVVAGTNCSGGGTSGDVTINVDDAFLINNGSDTTTGTITAGGFTTTGTITMPELTDDAAIGITKIQDSGTSFTDNDTSIMTAAAIADKIEGYGYSTTAGDMTGVDLTGGTGISIDSETNTTSGAYSSTITCNLEGTELISTGEGGGNKYLREDGDGSCSWQSVSASGNFVTDNAADIMAVSDFGAVAALKIDADQPATAAAEDSKGLWIDYDRIVAASGTAAHNDIGIDLDVNAASLGTSSVIGMDIDVVGATSGTHTAIGIDLDVNSADTNIGILNTTLDGGIDYKQVSSADSGDYFSMATTTSGATTLTTVDGGAEDAHLTLDADGFIIFKGTSGGDGLQFVPHHSGRWNIQNNTQNESIYFFLNHGGSSTVLMEMNAEEPYVQFRNAGVGFDRNEATFSATAIVGSGGTDDTDIDFRIGNKFRLELTGDITTVNLVFPTVSGNFVLVCRTDGDHDVTNWKVWESDESAATETDVMWSGGGSVPAFTDSGVDIVSFYWDADEQECYGVASLDFGT